MYKKNQKEKEKKRGERKQPPPHLAMCSIRLYCLALAIRRGDATIRRQRALEDNWRKGCCTAGFFSRGITTRYPLINRQSIKLCKRTKKEKQKKRRNTNVVMTTVRCFSERTRSEVWFVREPFLCSMYNREIELLVSVEVHIFSYGIW